ncbi:MAG: hypothetical protein Q9222_001416 [Ikaeria aurantiellina]
MADNAPPYTEQQHLPVLYPESISSTSAPHASSSKRKQPSPAPTGPPAPDYDTPRILHIYRDGLTHRHMTITDMDKSYPLYTISQNSGSIFSSKPHMTITSASSPSTTIGTATFHNWSRTIDLTFHSHPASFDSEGIFTRAYAFDSPAFGERLRWECDGIWGADLVLVNTKKEWIARFDASLFSITKNGKIHVVNGSIRGEALDEVVVSGCAMVQLERRRRNNSAAAGAASG